MTGKNNVATNATNLDFETPLEDIRAKQHISIRRLNGPIQVGNDLVLVAARADAFLKTSLLQA